MSKLFNKVLIWFDKSKINYAIAKHFNKNRLTQNELKECFEHGKKLK